jgi:hypothetical protein
MRRVSHFDQSCNLLRFSVLMKPVTSKKAQVGGSGGKHGAEKKFAGEMYFKT